MAQGKDIDSMILSDKPPKSLGHGKVTKPNLKNIYDIKKILHYMCIKVAKRLRDNEYVSNTFIIALRIKDGWLSRKYKISKYTHHSKDIFRLCLMLIENLILKNGIYQVQVTAIHLRPINFQKDLFNDSKNHTNSIDYIIDDVNNKFWKSYNKTSTIIEETQAPDVISPSWRPKGCKKSYKKKAERG